ncbi:hypothetical protein [Olivibacter sp. XZL3]|uniref:hypothetical protein n=1 Tax=Olivibacter sp. XZL3 TaxID=1735116 RepID=UPI0010652268|nr:hypothetical protein [Olivibacter sp. XZL3]
MLLQNEKIIYEKERCLFLVCVLSFLLSSFFFYDKTSTQYNNQFTSSFLQDYALDDVVSPFRQIKKHVRKEHAKTALNNSSAFNEFLTASILGLPVFYRSMWYKPYYYRFLARYKLF